MYTAKCKENESFQQGQLRDYGNVELSPAAGVLNYGQVQHVHTNLTFFFNRKVNFFIT